MQRTSENAPSRDCLKSLSVVAVSLKKEVQHAENGRFWPYFASPETFVLRVSRVFRQSLEGEFSELPLHRVLGSSSEKFQRSLIWGMRPCKPACYGGCVVQRGGADHPALYPEGGTVRRLLLLVALAMVAALVLAPAAVAATSGAQENVECGDVSHGKAQAILAKDPSDPNGLDADNDGEACEENAGDGSAATPEADDSTATSEADDETATSNATAEADDDE